MKLLAMYKLSEESISNLSNIGFDVHNVTVSQNQLVNYINANNFEALIIGENNKISNALIDDCKSLKLIACAFNNTNNVDEKYANLNNINVVKVKNASCVAVAELVFAHLLTMVRFLHQTNREMPLEGDMRFNELKNHFSKGTELKGKTLGIIGFNETEKEIIKIAIGLGMNVIVSSSSVSENNIELQFFDGQSINFEIKTQPIENLLKNADFITIHELIDNKQPISHKEIEKMKTGVGIINVCKPGLLDEVDLIKAIESKKVKYAALDIFEKQPQPEIQILMNPEISLSPNISDKTIDVKRKVETELVKNIKTYKNNN